MNKAELRERLIGGSVLDELFRWSEGQECYIFKADDFVEGDEIVYIPDLDLNGIPTDRSITDPDELEDVLSFCYTGDDFIDECDGNIEKAKRLFWYCDWQNPSSALPEIEDEE